MFSKNAFVSFIPFLTALIMTLWYGMYGKTAVIIY